MKPLCQRLSGEASLFHQHCKLHLRRLTCLPFYPVPLSSLTQGSRWPPPPWCSLVTVALCRHHNRALCTLPAMAAGLAELGQANPCYGIQTEEGCLGATLASLGENGEGNLKDFFQRWLLVIDPSWKETGDPLVWGQGSQSFQGCSLCTSSSSTVCSGAWGAGRGLCDGQGGRRYLGTARYHVVNTARK